MKSYWLNRILPYHRDRPMTEAEIGIGCEIKQDHHYFVYFSLFSLRLLLLDYIFALQFSFGSFSKKKFLFACFLDYIFALFIKTSVVPATKSHSPFGISEGASAFNL